jgi:hypothetical protein
MLGGCRKLHDGKSSFNPIFFEIFTENIIFNIKWSAHLLHMANILWWTNLWQELFDI